MKFIHNEISDTVHKSIWCKVYDSVNIKISSSSFRHTNNQLTENIQNISINIRYILIRELSFVFK